MLGDEIDEENEIMIPQPASKKAQIKQINDFKLRVLEYINIFLKTNPRASNILHIARSLAEAMKIALQDGNNDLYQKARNILIELGKNKESLEAMKEDEEITECATQMLAIMFKLDIKKAEGYKLVLLLCLKVLESQESKRKQVISIIKNLLCGFLTKKTKSLQESFFIEYLGQHLEIAWSLLIP